MPRLSNRMTREKDVESFEEPNPPRSLELDLEVPRHPQRVHEIDRPVASNLVAIFTPSIVFA